MEKFLLPQEMSLTLDENENEVGMGTPERVIYTASFSPFLSCSQAQQCGKWERRKELHFPPHRK